ncbi:hypothetical protein, partial [Oceanithermus sp.]
MKIEMSLPNDADLLADLHSCWDDALQIAVRLDDDLLAELVENGFVLDERQTQKGEWARSRRISGHEGTLRDFPGLEVVPPSPLPYEGLRNKRPSMEKAISTGRVTHQEPDQIVAQALVIQVIPHHNGEIFLSKTAVNQNPKFFGWPFTGKTRPKKASNPSYPQREPDPVVNIRVFDKSGTLIVEVTDF